MKKIITSMFLIASLISFGQNVKDKNETINTIVEHQPEFPGGMGQMMQFIVKNVNYPKEAIDKNIQGRVFVSFIIEKDGRLSNIKYVELDKKVHSLLVDEAIRVVSLMPNWSPGTQRGKKVRVQYTVPINFKITDPKKTKKKKRRRKSKR